MGSAWWLSELRDKLPGSMALFSLLLCLYKFSVKSISKLHWWDLPKLESLWGEPKPFTSSSKSPHYYDFPSLVEEAQALPSTSQTRLTQCRWAWRSHLVTSQEGGPQALQAPAWHLLKGMFVWGHKGVWSSTKKSLWNVELLTPHL